MTIRSFSCWLLLSMAALIAASLAESMGADSNAILSTLQQIKPVAVAEPSRALFMIIGLGAVVICYRQAWRNFRSKS